MLLQLLVATRDEAPAEPNLLEYSYMTVLGLLVVVVGIFSLVVVARLVEPRGVRVLLRRLLGRD